ncbi:GNAT family N-acetyltransferase [Corynebacterium epidermidicanis]|uniref:Putative acetyltransferase n=1 Tax=Corynebacterium epidermidicanis TaxID=1050174 RepID=A0A0G3GXH3_9CORY|nr:GNAT family N-acetyltransferase [Corynebacterium epidermidicanis]AKK04213.1 putative acetyltransferase [Corynebacterium epidermidicanis]
MTLKDKTGAEVDVTKEDSSYVIRDDAGNKLGATCFMEHENERVFYHTEIGDEFSGRGLATVLIATALDDTFNEGKTVVPVCPAVKHYVTHHPEELGGEVRKPTTADIDFVRSNL